MAALTKPRGMTCAGRVNHPGTGHVLNTPRLFHVSTSLSAPTGAASDDAPYRGASSLSALQC